MHLILAVESEQRHGMAQPSCRFDAAGGLVGRDPAATWVLADPRLSAQHLRIGFEAGRFYLTDLSRNGTFVNDQEQPIGRGQSHELADGDRIRIGDYRILAQLHAAAPARLDLVPDARGVGMALHDTLLDEPRQARDADPLAHLEASPFAATPRAPIPPGPRLDARRGRGGDDDLADLFAEDGDEPEPLMLTEPVSPPPVVVPVVPPPVAKPAAALIPEDWDAGLLGTPIKPPPVLAPPPRPVVAEPAETGMAETLTLLQQRAAARGSQAAPPVAPPEAMTTAFAPVAALWQALGVDPSRLPPSEQERFLTEVGLAMRELSAGLIQILAMRQGLKSEFRVDQTMMRAAENNLFKFTRTPDELFSMALTNRNRVFLPLDQAARSAFADMKAHEMAMLAAVQLSIRSVLDRFQPQKLRRQVEEKPSGWLARLGLRSVKARCWDFFTSIYTDLAADADEASNRIFTAEFGRAYRDRMEKPSGR